MGDKTIACVRIQHGGIKNLLFRTCAHYEPVSGLVEHRRRGVHGRGVHGVGLRVGGLVGVARVVVTGVGAGVTPTILAARFTASEKKTLIVTR